jgi:hypothetical protein
VKSYRKYVNPTQNHCEGEGETIVHGEIKAGFVELWISFSEE